MDSELKKQLEAAVTVTAIKAKNAETSIEALQYSQAALNAAQALVAMSNVP